MRFFSWGVNKGTSLFKTINASSEYCGGSDKNSSRVKAPSAASVFSNKSFMLSLMREMPVEIASGPNWLEKRIKSAKFSATIDPRVIATRFGCFFNFPSQPPHQKVEQKCGVCHMMYFTTMMHCAATCESRIIMWNSGKQMIHFFDKLKTR